MIPLEQEKTKQPGQGRRGIRVVKMLMMKAVALGLE